MMDQLDAKIIHPELIKYKVINKIEDGEKIIIYPVMLVHTNSTNMVNIER